MQGLIVFLLVFGWLNFSAAIGSTESGKEPLPREKAFFGLHFDLHPGKTDTSLGADITEEMIAHLLTRVQPDYVQYDCKGHAGYTGYPTKIGWPSPGIVKDSLAIWRKVTRQFGVGLYIHYSGVWDSVAVEHHPEWARVNEKGEKDQNATSTFGPYVDEMLIPQLKEVVGAYDLDGLWVDGECWAAKWDYAPAALAAWKKATGYDEAPKQRSDPHWLEWKTFHRQQFEKYLCHWVDALHAFKPKLQITSNWMYTTLAPKPPVAKLDYLSGDYSPGLSVDRARVDARYLASTNQPWDLMAWGFNKGVDLGWSLKTPIHLQQEAAVVLMQGGGFQIYNNPTRSGYLIDGMIETLGQVADFCRVRKEVSHKSATIPQVAVLYSSESQWDASDSLFSGGGSVIDNVEGTLQALLENHYSVDILAEHQLQPVLEKYPLVVIPDSPKLTDNFKQVLLAYVKNGGSLLLLGEKCARLFAGDLGVKLEGEAKTVHAELQAASGVVNANGVWQPVTPTAKAKAVGFWYPTRDTRKDGNTAATLISYGKGKIGTVWGPVGMAFFKSHHPYLREFIGDRARELFAKPAVTLNGPPCVDLALRHTAEGKLSVHLLNRANASQSDRWVVIDFIPSVGPLDLQLQTPKKPAAVKWVPDGGDLKWDWKDGQLSVQIPRLAIHGVLVIE